MSISVCVCACVCVGKHQCVWRCVCVSISVCGGVCARASVYVEVCVGNDAEMVAEDARRSRTGSNCSSPQRERTLESRSQSARRESGFSDCGSSCSHRSVRAKGVKPARWAGLTRFHRDAPQLQRIQGAPALLQGALHFSDAESRGTTHPSQQGDCCQGGTDSVTYAQLKISVIRVMRSRKNLSR